MYQSTLGEDYFIQSGRIYKIFTLGGGLSSACIDTSTRTYCAPADSSLHLKVGEVGFIQSAVVIKQKSATNPDSNFIHVDRDWFISEADAKALLATGKFGIMN